MTDRYTAQDGLSEELAGSRLLVDVFDPGGQRVSALVSVVDAGDPRHAWVGHSHDDSQDTNNVLAFNVPKGRTYRIVATGGIARSVERQVDVAGDEHILRLVLPSCREDETTRRIATTARRWFDDAETDHRAERIHASRRSRLAGSSASGAASRVEGLWREPRP